MNGARHERLLRIDLFGSASGEPGRSPCCGRLPESAPQPGERKRLGPSRDFIKIRLAPLSGPPPTAAPGPTPPSARGSDGLPHSSKAVKRPRM
ncbi:MAG: hypothetical protein AVDCRST_MAG51-554 [uncultured Ramlibacter sp.]|uniref:Uncharacterized protein n=1 Tax=uncultured Ramlibacter sp. TaxID=260755 RepID=A0A6J4NQM5_9BURK|nr:MAG: hypothetical protein AVDCRST_MAG51-554 [uncultured Ramlibacter sp.]